MAGLACWAAVHQGHGVCGGGQDRASDGEDVGEARQGAAPGQARQAAHQRVPVLGPPVDPGPSQACSPHSFFNFLVFFVKIPLWDPKRSLPQTNCFVLL